LIARGFREKVAKERDIEPQAAGKTLCQRRTKTLFDAALKIQYSF